MTCKSCRKQCTKEDSGLVTHVNYSSTRTLRRVHAICIDIHSDSAAKEDPTFFARAIKTKLENVEMRLQTERRHLIRHEVRRAS